MIITHWIGWKFNQINKSKTLVVHSNEASSQIFYSINLQKKYLISQKTNESSAFLFRKSAQLFLSNQR